MPDNLERSKTTVTAFFFDLMFNACRSRESIERYAGSVYIQHDPHVADPVLGHGGFSPGYSYAHVADPDGYEIGIRYE